MVLWVTVIGALGNWFAYVKYLSGRGARGEGRKRSIGVSIQSSCPSGTSLRFVETEDPMI